MSKLLVFLSESLIFLQKTTDSLRKRMREFPTLAQYEQAKTVSQTFSFLQRYSIAKFENCVSACHADTVSA